MNARSWRPPPDIKAGIQLFVSFVILLAAAIPLGSAVRHEMSPWIWRELRNRPPTSAVDAALAVLIYGAFYALGFLVPYWITTFIMFLQRLNPVLGGAGTPPMSARHRQGRLFIGLAGQTLFLLFLDSILSFARAVPSDCGTGGC